MEWILQPETVAATVDSIKFNRHPLLAQLLWSKKVEDRVGPVKSSKMRSGISMTDRRRAKGYKVSRGLEKIVSSTPDKVKHGLTTASLQVDVKESSSDCASSPCACLICNVSFGSKQLLANHLISHLSFSSVWEDSHHEDGKGRGDDPQNLTIDSDKDEAYPTEPSIIRDLSELSLNPVPSFLRWHSYARVSIGKTSRSPGPL